MGLTRIELSGRLLKAPILGMTPSGRALLRLSVDCGEEHGPLVLEVLVMGDAARDLARALSVGQWISAVGSVRAVRHGALGSGRHQQLQVVATEVHAGQFESGLVRPDVLGSENSDKSEN